MNLVAELRGLLRGGGCRPFTGDGAVETRPGQIRRPDVGVDCGARDPNGTLAASPRILIEVLSPSTRDFDSFKKLDEYTTIASVNAIILACVWSRDETGQWRERTVRCLDAVIELPAPPIALRMEAIFDGVQFPASPRLVQSQESA